MLLSVSAVMVSMVVIQEKVFVGTVHRKSSSCDSKSRKQSSESISPCERSSIPPSLAVVDAISTCLYETFGCSPHFLAHGSFLGILEAATRSLVLNPVGFSTGLRGAIGDFR